MDAAHYRLAQESLTNAVRHAKGATRVEIDVRREGDAVRLRVSDDGQTGAGAGPGASVRPAGHGRTCPLLGGSLSAGPGPEGGWVVEAVLPAEALT